MSGARNNNKGRLIFAQGFTPRPGFFGCDVVPGERFSWGILIDCDGVCLLLVGDDVGVFVNTCELSSVF